MKWLEYLLEANLYLVLFYAVYYLLLRRETYYQLNRIYLLASSLLAFIIPLLQIGILKPVHIAAQSTQLTAAYVVPVTRAIRVNNIAVTPSANINYCLMFYLLVALGLTIAFGVRLYQLVRLARKGRHTPTQNFNMIEIENEDHAFSFFNYLFIGKQISTSSTIIQHELVHIRQKHSIDIVYLELLKIICWFNPVAYLLQNNMKEVHEFIADNHIADENVNGYTDFLISNAYGLYETNLTNNFFNKNLLKTRIMMLHQKRSGNLARLKYLVTLPLLAGMLCLSTLGFTKDYALVDLAPADGIVKPTLPPVPAPPAVQTGVDKVLLPPPPAPAIPHKTTHKMPPPAPTPVAPLPGAPAPATLAPPPPANSVSNADTTNKDYPFASFYRYVGKHVRYPVVARENQVQGKVFVTFNVNDDRSITNVFINRGLSDETNNEVIRVIKTYKAVPDFKTGVNYTMPVFFGIKGDDGKNIDPNGHNTPQLAKDIAANSTYKATGFPRFDMNEVVVISYPAKK